jgi:hypothetical protein
MDFQNDKLPDDKDKPTTYSSNDTLELLRPTSKKRGRRPKGGAIITPSATTIVINPSFTPSSEKEPTKLIILHLKCKLKDLLIEDNLSFVGGSSNDLVSQASFEPTMTAIINVEQPATTTNVQDETIKKKMEELSVRMHLNNIICDRKSPCFYCTCPFENTPVRIPICIHPDGVIDVYSHHCSVGCACAFLMKEHIDMSVKTTRLELLNHIYGNLFGIRSICPAPDPYYTLDKYMGSLTIDEYRRLSFFNTIYTFTDKPLSKIYPELHEDMLTSIDQSIKKEVVKRKTNTKTFF